MSHSHRFQQNLHRKIAKWRSVCVLAVCTSRSLSTLEYSMWILRLFHPALLHLVCNMIPTIWTDLALVLEMVRDNYPDVATLNSTEFTTITALSTEYTQIEACCIVEAKGTCSSPSPETFLLVFISLSWHFCVDTQERSPRWEWRVNLAIYISTTILNPTDCITMTRT